MASGSTNSSLGEVPSETPGFVIKRERSSDDETPFADQSTSTPDLTDAFERSNFPIKQQQEIPVKCQQGQQACKLELHFEAESSTQHYKAEPYFESESSTQARQFEISFEPDSGVQTFKLEPKLEPASELNVPFVGKQRISSSFIKNTGDNEGDEVANVVDGPPTSFTFVEVPSKMPPFANECEGLGNREIPRAVRKRKSRTEYQRAYRARKRAECRDNQKGYEQSSQCRVDATGDTRGEEFLNMASPNLDFHTVLFMTPQSYNDATANTGPSMSVENSTKSVTGLLVRRRRKTMAEYQRACRLRRKAKRLIKEKARERAALSEEQRRLLIREYQRLYRARKKSEEANERRERRYRLSNPAANDAPSTPKPSLPSARQRRYKARQVTKRENIPLYQRVPSLFPHGAGDGANKDAIGLAFKTSQQAARPSYTHFNQHDKAHCYFDRNFVNDPFGFPCRICDRLWFKQDLLRMPGKVHRVLIDILLPGVTLDNVKVCSACHCSLRANRVPTLAVYNGFKYPPIPSNLPPLDVITERLISPRIPFMEIKRLRHISGQSGIFAQVINVPLNVNTMVKRLPRDLDDYSVNVHVKKRKIHKSSNIERLVNKRTVREWLTFLGATPLYRDIVIDPTSLGARVTDGEMPDDDTSEEASVDSGLVAQQQTLLLDDGKHLQLSPEEKDIAANLPIDDYAEELSFPAIYLGQMRTFREDVKVTPYQIASSEIRRSDRRGVTPRHLLYAAARNMSLLVSSALKEAFKSSGAGARISKEQTASEDYVDRSLDTDLAFLKSIPNSAYHRAQRKKDVFAMIRQFGRPTISLTMSANEIEWTGLIQLLKRTKEGNEISADEAANLNQLQKCKLVNDDAVTCALYFDKLINTLMSILQSKTISPFGQYRVEHFFRRIDFQNEGGPLAHYLLWLENSSDNLLDENKRGAISLIDSLISVSASEASGNIELQRHKHTVACYKKVRANEAKKCRFGAPFLPSRSTQILVPMNKEEPGFDMYAERYEKLVLQYDVTDYDNIDDFYEKNNIISDADYNLILRAGIERPRVFLKREPSEKWHIPFNPFVFHHLQSWMDVRFILDERSCATYIVDYVNEADRGVSDLQRKIAEITDKHPDFGMTEIAKKMGVDFVNSVEMSCQEAAWWLLRKPMSEASRMIVFIPTAWPKDRCRMQKAQRLLAELDDETTNIRKENIFDKYERRPRTLKYVTLARFAALYMRRNKGWYKKLAEPQIIRYVNYSFVTEFNEYKREMVTLHIPFRNEESEILAESKFLQIYADNESIILERRREFESNVNIEDTVRLCEQLFREE